jgi:AraC-like DNA-binding protein
LAGTVHRFEAERLEGTDIRVQGLENAARFAIHEDVLFDVQAAPAPLSQLATYVENVSVHVPVADRRQRVELLPDGTTSLLFRVLEHGRHGDVSVLGPRTHALFKNAPRVPLCVVVRFRPGLGSSLLGIPSSNLTDRFVPLDDIWGREEGERIRQRLLAARSPANIIEELGRVLLARLQRQFEPASSRLARRAVRLWQEDQNLRVAHVAGELGVTERHLRRTFIESVGLRPKEFARMARLQKAVRGARNGSDWADIAVDAGYYDQAHLIAEFRDLLGITPGEFIAHRDSSASAFARECPLS